MVRCFSSERMPKWLDFRLRITEEPMTRKFSLLLLFWLLLLSPQLAACAGGESQILPVKEAAITAHDKPSYWLDNTHVLFWGFTGVEPGPGVQIGPGKEVRLLNEGYYVWDIEQNTVTKDARFEQSHPLCINGHTKSYVFTYSPDGKTSKRRAFVDGQEIALPERTWVNPISCRAATARPPWVVNGRATRPLLEEHGYLDRGIFGEDRHSHSPILYYRTDVSEPISLGLEGRHVDPLFTYCPFADAYLLRGGIGTYHAPLLWFLHPTGTVEQIFNPDGKPWANYSWSWLALTKRGPIFASLHTASSQSSEAGLYLWDGKILMNIRRGYFSWGVVSPDGCKMAFSAHNRGKDVPLVNRNRLQIVDVCQGGEHVN